MMYFRHIILSFILLLSVNIHAGPSPADSDLINQFIESHQKSVHEKREIARLTAEKERLEKNLQITQQHLTQISEYLRKQTQENTALKTRLVQHLQEQEKMVAALEEKEAEIQQESALFNETKGALNAQVELITNENKEIKAQLSEKEAADLEMREKIATLRQQNTDQADRLTALSQETQTLTQKLETLQTDNNTLLHTQATHQNTLGQTEAKNQHLREKLDASAKSLKELQEALRGEKLKTETFNDLKTQLALKDQEITRLQKEVTETQDLLKQAKEEHTAQLAQLKEAYEAQIQDIRAQYAQHLHTAEEKAAIAKEAWDQTRETFEKREKELETTLETTRKEFREAKTHATLEQEKLQDQLSTERETVQNHLKWIADANQRETLIAHAFRKLQSEKNVNMLNLHNELEPHILERLKENTEEERLHLEIRELLNRFIPTCTTNPEQDSEQKKILYETLKLANEVLESDSNKNGTLALKNGKATSSEGSPISISAQCDHILEELGIENQPSSNESASENSEEAQKENLLPSSASTTTSNNGQANDILKNLGIGVSSSNPKPHETASISSDKSDFSNPEVAAILRGLKSPQPKPEDESEIF